MSQISITLSVTASQLAAIAAIMGGAETAPAAETKPAARKAKAEETPVEQERPEVKAKDAAGDEVAEVDQAAVTAAAQSLMKANGRDALKEMLEKHGAASVTGVPADKRQAFIDEVEAAIATK